jgi:hypothetical protein
MQDMRESELHTPHLHTPTYTPQAFSKAGSAAITHPPPLNPACNALRKVVPHKRINACAALNLEGLAQCGACNALRQIALHKRINEGAPLNLEGLAQCGACNALRQIALHKRINEGAPLNLEGLAHCGKSMLARDSRGASVYTFLARPMRHRATKIPQRSRGNLYSCRMEVKFLAKRTCARFWCAAKVAIAFRESRGAFVYAFIAHPMREKLLPAFVRESGWLQNGGIFPCETHLRQKVVRS